MGLDLSERRLADARVMTLFDDMNNWVADTPSPKYLLAITETQSTDRGEPVNRPHKVLGDDTYGMNPVNYVKVNPLPGPDDMSTLIDAIRRGDFFATTGEVLIPSYSVQGQGSQRTVVADVEWTFPLEFVEVVWGDGQKTDRQIIAATDLAPFGKKRFQSHGFDNIAASLTMSPTLMESYVRAADAVSRLATGDPGVSPHVDTYRVPQTYSQKEHVEGAPLGTRGGIAVRHFFPADGEYMFGMSFYHYSGKFFGALQDREQIEVSVDGRRVALLDVNLKMTATDELRTPPIKVAAGAGWFPRRSLRERRDRFRIS